MPEDDPGTCTGPEAEKVAAYIYDAFYSRTAQARNAPARVELARLTVRQYRNAVADLIGSFREAGKLDDRRGLPGEYQKTRRSRGGTPALARVDPTVRFDWKLSSPDPEKVPPKEFSARWQGSVFAPETGEYEFIVRSQNSARLWVNDQKTMLVDAWVRSGKDTEHRAAVRLSIGGRWYPIRLEFAKGKDGSKDNKDPKEKEPEEPASIELAWRPPHGVDETVPARCLSPGKAAETFVLEAPFPPDDRSLGYERGTSVSKAWDSATTDAAIEVGDHVVAHLRDLSGVGDGDGERAKKLQEFALKFAERAFRRPLADDERQIFAHRAALRQGEDAGGGAQAGRPAGAQVAEVPLPGGRRDARRLRGGLADQLRPLGLDPRDQAADRRGQIRPTRKSRAGREAGRADARRPAGQGQAPRVPAPVAQGRRVPGAGEGQGAVPGLRRGGRGRPRDVA